MKKMGLAEVLFVFGEELSVPISEAAMTPQAFSKSLVRTENGSDLYGRVIRKERK